MFLDKALEEIGKKNKVVVGLDLENDYCQISYCTTQQAMPDTLSLVMGEEQYNIPTVLCRSHNAEQAGETWTAGKEALQKAKAGEGILVEDILLLVKNQVSIEIEEKEYEPTYLLEVFLKKTLALLGAYIRLEEINAIAYTMKEMDPAVMQQVNACMDNCRPRHAVVFPVSHKDCFFSYIMHQPKEIWLHDVILYDYRMDGIRSYRLGRNPKTSPVVCYIEEEDFPQMRHKEVEEEAKEAYFRQLDSAFLEIVKEQCEKGVVTSAFLLGDIFSKDWCRESLRHLCHGRRVFQGNNLFSKGACYAAQERIEPSEISATYVYLSDEKLRANIGLPCNRGKEETYLPLLDAGMNWFEAKKELDLILAKDNSIMLTITPLVTGAPRMAKITLEGLHVRGNRTNRVGFRIFMTDADTVEMEITDKGFGEFFPTTGQSWRESFVLE